LITKILVAIDGSECSERALDFALDLAEKYSASLLIMNVLQMPVYGSPEEPMAVSAGTVTFAKDLREVHEGLLAKAAERAASAKPNVQVITALREGNPPAQIVAAATEGSFDVVVLGHSGQGRFREWLLGSTTERVAHLARCVVIIVK
jgi:nucleotide-binding universal stress UspA family protein